MEAENHHPPSNGRRNKIRRRERKSKWMYKGVNAQGKSTSDLKNNYPAEKKNKQREEALRNCL